MLCISSFLPPYITLSVPIPFRYLPINLGVVYTPVYSKGENSAYSNSPCRSNTQSNLPLPASQGRDSPRDLISLPGGFKSESNGCKRCTTCLGFLKTHPVCRRTQTLITDRCHLKWWLRRKLGGSEKSLPIFVSANWTTLKAHGRCEHKIHVCIPGSSSRSSHYLLCANNKDGCQAKLQMNNVILHKLPLPWAMVSTWWTLRNQANIPSPLCGIMKFTPLSRSIQSMCMYFIIKTKANSQVCSKKYVSYSWQIMYVIKSSCFRERNIIKNIFFLAWKILSTVFQLQFYRWSTANLYSRWTLM